MTDEERKEAERLAHEYNESTRDHSVRAYTIGDVKAYERLAFSAGYAAACEAKKWMIDSWLEEEKHWHEKFEAERARSAKLILAVDSFVDRTQAVSKQTGENFMKAPEEYVAMLAALVEGKRD